MAERKPVPKLTEAAAKATAALQTLQSRLNQEITPLGTREELGEELQQYFAKTGGKAQPAAITGAIQMQVVEAIVDRILVSWGEPHGQLSVIKNEVIARLVDRVWEELLNREATPKAQFKRP